MSEKKLKDIVKMLKRTFGMKVIVREYDDHSVKLIVLKRGDFDEKGQLLITQGGEIMAYDPDRMIKVFSLNGFTITILSHQECG